MTEECILHDEDSVEMATGAPCIQRCITDRFEADAALDHLSEEFLS